MIIRNNNIVYVLLIYPFMSVRRDNIVLFLYEYIQRTTKYVGNNGQPQLSVAMAIRLAGFM